MRVRASVAVVVFGVAVMALSASGAETRRHEKLKIGIVAFSGPKDLAGGRPSAATAQLKLYLQNVSIASRIAPPPSTSPYPIYDFDIYVGSYYQIHSWLRSGDLDGAVVSPMTEYLLQRTPNLGYEQVVEFGDGDDVNPMLRGHQPLVGYPSTPRKGADPIGDYERYVDAVWAASEGTTIPEDVQNRLDSYRLEFVNHLSTSGFAAPLLFAHRIIETRLAGISDEHEQHERSDRFWSIFFRSVRLKLTHSENASAGDDHRQTMLTFSYKGVQMTPYGSRISADFLDPNDVLVLRPLEMSDRALDETHRQEALRALTGVVTEPANPWHVAATQSFPRGWRGVTAPGVLPDYGTDKPEYAVVGDVQAFAERKPGVRRDPADSFGIFSDALDKLFKDDGSLDELQHKWYVDQAYEFRPDEIATLLRQDQQLRQVHRTAIVLPGGGVRGAYQAAMLDELFDHGHVINSGVPKPPATSLVVDNVVGTSGGAMVGYFAAQRKPGTPGALAKLWLDKVVKATATTIFPLIALPRWFTVWLVVLVFATILLFYNAFASRAPVAVRAEHPAMDNPPQSFRLAMFLLTLMIPIITSFISTFRYIPSFEAVAYAVSILVAHFLYTCCGEHSHPTDLPRLHISRWIIGIGVSFALAATLAGPLWNEHFAARSLTSCVQEGGWATFAAVFGFGIIIMGMVMIADAMHIGLSRTRLIGYLKGSAVLGGVVSIAALIVFVGYRLQIATSIELTGAYWLWTGVGAIVATLTAILIPKFWSKNKFAHFVRDGIDYWRVNQDKRTLLRNPIWSLEAFAVCALLLWSIVVSPSLYSGCKADETFQRMQVDFNNFQGEKKANPKQPKFLSNLLVTTTSLGRKVPGSLRAFHGDYYCCVDGDECNRARGRRSNVLRFKLEQFPRAVFASGSPFPIFPALLLTPRGEKPGTMIATEDDDRGLFIDGGYAHNVPIEGAQVVGADQVLLIRNARRERDNRDAAPSDYGDFTLLSPLAWDAANILPFLFERSQQVDSAVTGKMFVASLAPDADHGQPPFLMDFRDATVRSLVADAQEDYRHRRIGQVESWGVPHIWTSILSPQ